MRTNTERVYMTALCIFAYTARNLEVVCARNSRNARLFPMNKYSNFHRMTRTQHSVSLFPLPSAALQLRFIFRDAKTTSNILMSAHTCIAVVCNPCVDSVIQMFDAFPKRNRNICRRAVTGWRNSRRNIVPRRCKALFIFIINYCMLIPANTQGI